MRKWFLEPTDELLFIFILKYRFKTQVHRLVYLYRTYDLLLFLNSYSKRKGKEGHERGSQHGLYCSYSFTYICEMLVEIKRNLPWDP